MNIYAVLSLVAAVGIFVYATGMSEPFGFIGEQFNSIIAHIRTNNVMFNSVILALVITLFVGVIRKLFARKEDTHEEEILEQLQRLQQQKEPQGRHRTPNR